LVGELQKELNERYQREASLEMALSERNKVEGELRKQLDEAKHHEEDLENELANMWVLVAKMRKSGVNAEDMPSEGVYASTTFGVGLKSGCLLSNGHSSRISKDETFENIDGMKTLEELKVSYQKERRKCKQLESIISRLKVFIFLTKLKLHNKFPFTAPG
jgi:centromeric protein E